MFSWSSILRIQNQIVFRTADAGEATAGLGRGVRLLEIINLAGFDGDDARAATARAAARINLHALRLGELQNIFQRRFPVDGLVRAREGDHDFLQMRCLGSGRRGGFFLHGCGTERLEVNYRVRKTIWFWMRKIEDHENIQHSTFNAEHSR